MLRQVQIASFTFQTLQWRELEEHVCAPALILSKGEAGAASVGGVRVQMEQVRVGLPWGRQVSEFSVIRILVNAVN